MRSLVTGGAGFIGSHLVDGLLDRGDSVTVVDDLSTGRRSNLARALERGAALVEVSLTDRVAIEELIRELEPERAFHLGAQVDVRKAVANPGHDALVNVLGTINLLEALRAVPTCPVVFASTGGAIYGEGDGRTLPFAETAPAVPEAPYGTSKLAGEQYVALYRRMYELPGLALRFGNVYGPRQDPHGEAGVVAIFCGLLRDGRPLRIFGDGSQTRDYVYVGDVVGALLAADVALATGGSDLTGPFNVGTGVETSVVELVDTLASAAGGTPKVVHEPARRGEVHRVSIDPSRAADVLGWTPATNLRVGLRSTYEAVGEAGKAGAARVGASD